MIQNHNRDPICCPIYCKTFNENKHYCCLFYCNNNNNCLPSSLLSSISSFCHYYYYVSTQISSMVPSWYFSSVLPSYSCPITTTVTKPLIENISFIINPSSSHYYSSLSKNGPRKKLLFNKKYKLPSAMSSKNSWIICEKWHRYYRNIFSFNASGSCPVFNGIQHPTKRCHPFTSITSSSKITFNIIINLILSLLILFTNVSFIFFNTYF